MRTSVLLALLSLSKTGYYLKSIISCAPPHKKMDSDDCRPKPFYGCHGKGNRRSPFTGLVIKKVPSSSLGQVDFPAGQVTFFFQPTCPIGKVPGELSSVEDPGGAPPPPPLVCRPN